LLRGARYKGRQAGVAELVDAHDSKSCSARSVGSIPTTRTDADIGYDNNATRRQIEANGTMPNIPPKANRRFRRETALIGAHRYVRLDRE
jgi:hypothetical protein